MMNKTWITQMVGCLLLVFTVTTFAENWQYSIIVDAGSTNSRLHLFRYQINTSSPNNNLPIIEDISIAPYKNNIALASFNQNPQTAESSLDALFNAAITTLQTQAVDPKTVSVRIYGTAGMRLIGLNEQNNIYSTLVEHLKHQYGFISITARTISGKEEGIYDWLAVNYLANNFSDTNATVGIIDVGGASMEIAFATKEATENQDTVLRINGQNYTLYSNSILGLGQDEARNFINKDLTSGSCYPSGYSSSTGSQYSFDFRTCDNLYSKILNNKLQLNDKPLIASQQKFIAFGSVYYVYKFFSPIPNRNTLENNIYSICATSWQTLKTQYPADAYLANECANGVYIDELLFGKNGYLLQDSQIQVSNVINQKPIDWPIGALLYENSINLKLY